MKSQWLGFFVFGVAFSLSLAVNGFLTALATKPLGIFDQHGIGWLVLKAVYHGLVAIAAYLCYFAIASRSGWCFGIALLLVALIVSDVKLGTSYESILDRLALLLGYSISRSVPYQASDHPLPARARPALEIDSECNGLTAIGPVKIASGKGCLRKITFFAQTQSISVVPDITSKDLVFPDPKLRWADTGFYLKEVQGIRRCFYREGVRSFASRAEAERWLTDLRRSEPAMVLQKGELILLASRFAATSTVHFSLYKVVVAKTM